MLNIEVDVEKLEAQEKMVEQIAAILDDLPSVLKTVRFMREITQAQAAEEAEVLLSRYQAYESGEFSEIRFREVVNLLGLVRSVVPEPESGAVESTAIEPVETSDGEAFESPHPDPEERQDMTQWTLDMMFDIDPSDAEAMVRTDADRHYVAIPFEADWLLFGLHRNQVKVVDLLHKDLPRDSGDAEKLVQTGMNYGVWSEMNG